MEVVDITDDGLPDADGTQTDKIFLDRVRKTASFLTEDRIAQTDAAGNFTAYPESSTNGTLSWVVRQRRHRDDARDQCG